MREVFGIIIFAVVYGVIIFMAGYIAGSESIRDQAFERGHMVECIGRSGYYWECE